MSEDEVCHRSVITKRSSVSKEFLIHPCFFVCKDYLLPVAGKRSRKTCNRIKKSLSRFHNPESNVISDTLHLGKCICVSICNIGSSGNAAHLGILEGLNQMPYRIWIKEAVRINKDNKLMLCKFRTSYKSISLSGILFLYTIGNSAFKLELIICFFLKILDCFLYLLNRIISFLSTSEVVAECRSLSISSFIDESFSI